MNASPLLIEPVPPFRLDLTVWALRRRPHNEIDRWDGEIYRRSLVIEPDRVINLAVRQIGPLETPRLEVLVTGAPVNQKIEKVLRRVLDLLLGLSVDLRDFYTLAEKDNHLLHLAERFRGIKPPRFPSLFEGLVNGIACQQVSLHVGITLLNRLAARFGEASGGVHAFPRPKDLAGQDARLLRELGFSGHKVRSLLELSQGIHAGHVHLKRIEFLDDRRAVQSLTQFHGIGRWTAEYLLLRGLGRLNVFPGDDVGARTRLIRWLKLTQRLDYEGVRHAVCKWDPYAGVVYFLLLLNSLAANVITD